MFVEARDPEGFAVTYSLDAAPSGVRIDPRTGLIAWVPDFVDVGPAIIEVRATDVHGLSTTGVVFTEVFVDTEPPSVALRLVRGAFCPGA